MKNLTKAALGILTSVGGYLEAGSIGTALQAGARFRFSLLWAILIGTICVAFLVEMTGRLAAVSHHTVFNAIRKRFGFSFHAWPLGAQMIVDVLVLASEVAGASLALQLATGVSERIWAVPVVVLLWAILWLGTFGTIEHGTAVLGMVTLSFVVAAWRLGPDWHAVGRGFVPQWPQHDPPQYAYLAVGILGATISPYLVSFYSSGAIEDHWTVKDLAQNRIVAGFGMGFGSAVSMAVLIVSALVLAPHGVRAETYQESAWVLMPALGRAGYGLFCASLAIGCIGAALELALDLSYISAQSFGWNWGENQRPATEARFALVYTTALVLSAIPSLLGVDPLKLTMFSMGITVLALPLIVAPLVLIMNDKTYLKSHTNGWIANTAVCTILVLGAALALVAIPLQLIGGG